MRRLSLSYMATTEPNVVISYLSGSIYYKVPDCFTAHTLMQKSLT